MLTICVGITTASGLIKVVPGLKSASQNSRSQLVSSPGATAQRKFCERH